MGPAGFYIKGIDEVVQNLAHRATQIRQGTADGVNKTAIDIERDAKKSMRGAPEPSAPDSPPRVVTDRLRSSIGIRQEASPDDPAAYVAAGTEYAEPLEFGTTNMAARPFMTPAYTEQIPNLKPNITAMTNRRLGA